MLVLTQIPYRHADYYVAIFDLFFDDKVLPKLGCIGGAVTHPVGSPSSPFEVAHCHTLGASKELVKVN